MINDGTSNAREFLARVRDHYADQLRNFIAEQRRNCIRGEAEVKLDLQPGSKAFHSLACADFVRNDGEPEIITFTPDRALGFDPITTTLGKSKLQIEQLRWDDVVIHHNLMIVPEQELGAWFEKWFDPDDRRYRPGAELGDVIHSLIIEPSGLRVDFGSAAPDAFWELLNLLEEAGATELRVAGSLAEAPMSWPVN